MAITHNYSNNTEKNSLLDIIAEITAKESASASSALAASHQTPTKSPPTTPKRFSKCKGATSGGATVPEESEHKRTRTTRAKTDAIARTPLTSPNPSQKKKKLVVTLQGSPKDHLRSVAKKKKSKPFSSCYSKTSNNRGVPLPAQFNFF